MSLTIRIHQNDSGNFPSIPGVPNLRTVAVDPADEDYRLVTAPTESDFAEWLRHFAEHRVGHDIVQA
jgi:hypothetical protein